MLGAECRVLSAVLSAECRVLSARSRWRRPPDVESGRGRHTCNLQSSICNRQFSTYVSLLIMSKMGMYIATTMPPTITPRNAIITGSINVSMPATAVSTSSS